MKKNVTIVMDEETARWVRVEAARQDTSVSQYLGGLVERERRRDQQYDSAMARFLERAPRPLGKAGQGYPTRDRMHER